MTLKLIKTHINVRKNSYKCKYKYNRHFKVVLLKKLIYIYIYIYIYMICDIKYNYIVSINKKCEFCKYALIMKLYERFDFIKYQ